MTTFALYPIEKVLPHPQNVRRVAKASEEMIASVAAAGVLEPVILGPDTGDGVRYLIAGNVRHNAAVEAGLTTLPAVLRDDLATEAQQIEAMLVENLHRTDLTAVEEADAYSQLQLFGMDVAAIADATGRSKTTVKARLKLTALPEKARTVVHEGQATLADAEALLEFADNPEVVETLTAELGGKDFRWKVQEARGRRDRVARNRAMVEEYVGLGAVEVSWDGEPRPARIWWSPSEGRDTAIAPHVEAGCLGYTNPGEDSYQSPDLMCTNPASHEDEAAAVAVAAERAQAAADREAYYAEQQARSEALDAARVVRVDHTTAHIISLLAGQKRTTDAIAGLTRAFLPYALADSIIEEVLEDRVLDQALGLDTVVADGDRWTAYQQARDTTATQLVEATTNELISALAGFLATFLENALTKPANWYHADATAEDRNMAAVAWEWLAASGYELSTVEEELRDKAMYGTQPTDGDEGGDDE